MLERRKLSSPWWLGLATLTLTAAASGCIVEHSDCDDRGGSAGGGVAGMAGNTSQPPSGDIVLATIDTNKTLETDPGEGIGAFIEYQEGGRWHVYTACDTDLSGLPCYFNVIAILPPGASYVSTEESLESEDVIYEYDDGVELVTVTSSDLDGMYIDVPAGEVVRFEVWLDDEPDARFIYWFGGGAVHNGAPSNPLDLKPSEP